MLFFRRKAKRALKTAEAIAAFAAEVHAAAADAGLMAARQNARLAEAGLLKVPSIDSITVTANFAIKAKGKAVSLVLMDEKADADMPSCRVEVTVSQNVAAALAAMEA